MNSQRNGATPSNEEGEPPDCHGTNEPIAIIGIGCRLPGGANDPNQFWQNLIEGVDAIGEIPSNRWDVRSFYDPEPGRPGKTNARWGGFVDTMDQFDAAFFGISPREAARMDPQQRIVMEVAWEALEDAGLPLSRLSGTNAAVFIGVSSYDYSGIQVSFLDRSGIDVYSNTGGALSIIANRISYNLDLRGPSAIVDTACSSALVATHLACEAIWRDGCPIALAGGVNALYSPDGFIGFSRLSMLAADGRCRAFDAEGKGFVRSEGAGVVVLKKLACALADGDPIYAVIRATGSNQDGKTAGMTVPSQHSQEELLRLVYRRAGIHPSRVKYVEAHGTGTPVGDPIEARALGAVLATGRPADQPCLIGSVKSNIGHMESGSGIAGLIKTALVLKHRQVPPNLHFHTPHPDIPFTDLRLRVPTQVEALPRGAEPLMAGVNSFGFGGTNAHVLLEEPPRKDDSLAENHGLNGHAQHDDVVRLFPLSGRSADAVPTIAGLYEHWLRGNHTDLNDLLHNLARRRTHHEHRLAILARSRNELLEALHSARAGEAHSAVFTGRALAADAPGLVWVFSGQGPQWWGMGRQLMRQEPVFRSMIERCDQVIRQLGSWSLLEELGRDETTSRIQETAIAQPAIFAVQAGLAALWSHWGIKPAAIVGHSVGEVAAAHAAGVLSLEDAATVIFHRGRCMEFATAGGRMLAVGLPFEEARELIAPLGDAVTVAAINGPASLTLSGEGPALERLAESLENRQVFNRFLQVRYAFHSSQMEPAREPLLEALHSIRPQPAHTTLYSTVTARPVAGPEWGADYWWQNVRQPVQFADVIDQLIEAGHRVMLEIAPHPVLSGPILECCRHRSASGQVFPSLRRNEDERSQMKRSLAGLFTRGASLNWDHLAPQGRTLRLPLYPWQHERFWHESRESRETRVPHANRHPLLGRALPSAVPAWESRVGTRIDPYLADHCVQGHPLIPATAYLETALAAARAALPNGPHSLEEVRFAKACFLDNGIERVLQTSFNPQDSSFQIASRDSSGNAWTQHASGFLRARHHETPPALELSSVRHRCSTEVGRGESYSALRMMGLEYGPNFQGIERLWRGPGEALGEVALPESLRAAADDFNFHPALLDACLQVILAAVPAPAGEIGPREVYLPVEVAEVRVHGRPNHRVWSHARLVERTRGGLTIDLCVYDELGRPVWEARGLRCQSLGAEGQSGQSLDDLLYETRWVLQPRPGTGPLVRCSAHLPSPSAVAAEIRPIAERVAQQLGLRESYDGLQRIVDAICPGFVWQALQELAGPTGLPNQFTADELFATLGIEPRHRRLFDRYLKWFEQDGVVQRDGDSYRIIHPPLCSDPLTAWRELLIQQPTYFTEIMLMGRCGRNLPGVLRGDVNPLHLLFAEGTATGAEQLYSDSRVMQYYNHVARDAVERLAQDLPPGRVLRILEVGAGTGGLTVHVLPRLPADQTEYVYTDVTAAFFRKAGERFQNFPFVQYKTLDLEKDPIAQGFPEHSFDLILASQVLHATADLKSTLGHLRRLLASSGQLLFIEGIHQRRWIDLVFGLVEGWWRFTDRERRIDHPLLSTPEWQALLAEVGFTESIDVSLIPGRLSIGNAIVLSRGPKLDSAGAPGPLTPAESGGTVRGTPSWLIFSDRRGVGERLATLLQDRGESCTLVFRADSSTSESADHLRVSPLSLEKMQDVLRRVGAPTRGVLYLWAMDSPDGEEIDTERLLDAQTESGMGLIHLAQAWNNGLEVERPLWVITRGAHGPAHPGSSIAIAQTAIVGLRRVLRNEFHQLAANLVDLAGIDDETEMRALILELTVPDEEDELALCGEARYAPRFSRRSLRPTSERGEPSNDVSYRLEVARNNTIDGLTLRATPRRKPGSGEVEIRVHAAALNFSDVMKALGLYPGLPDGPVPLGIECSGEVVALGANVADLKIGDEVVALGPFCFSSYVTIPTALTARKPAHLSHEEAATLPVAYLTAHYALNHLGRMQPGERVLIHSAAGGVGLAAVQLAHEAGAEVFATAGTAEKREVLAGLGVRHIMDSRTLSFADEIMRITKGRGVDLVLNSLSGEAINKSLSVVGEYGRFLEIGKRDIYNNSRIGLLPFRKNVTFTAIDLDRAMRERPLLVAGQLREVLARVKPGGLAALPHRIFPMARAADAFRFMAQGKHLGKIVLTLHSHEAPTIVRDDDADPDFVRSDVSYLITGGLGGFGFTVARWLVERGARHLVLVGRSGISTPESQQAVESLRQSGANVHVARADVSRSADVERVLSEVADKLPPLRGVVHAAMVLDDCVLLSLTEERWRKVLAPKSGGAWNLHRLTRKLPLDFFVNFSSMSAVFGIAGQSNYAASNTVLDALARHRRAQGVAGLSVNWGFVGEVGYVARNEKLGERFEGWGVREFTPSQALQILGHMIHQGTDEAGVMNVNWAKFRPPGITNFLPPRFRALIRSHTELETQSGEGVPARQALLAVEGDVRKELMRSMLRDKVARVLGCPAAKLDLQKPLTELGLDSLMAVELRNWAEGELRVSLPMVELMHGPSVTRLGELLLEQLNKSEGAAPPANPAVQKAAPAAAVEQQVAQLSDNEVDRMLSAMLADGGTTRE